MTYLIIAILLFILLYIIKVNVILYNDLELIDTYRFIPLIIAIFIYIENCQYLNVDIYFNVYKFLDKLKSFKNK